MKKPIFAYAHQSASFDGASPIDHGPGKAAIVLGT